MFAGVSVVFDFSLASHVKVNMQESEGVCVCVCDCFDVRNKIRAILHLGMSGSVLGAFFMLSCLILSMTTCGSYY